MSKMNWQIEAYRNGTCEYEIQKTKAHKGTICIPTGGGKSGVMIRDILWHIDHAENKKLIFNISAPILNLCSQLAEDLFEVIAGTHKSNCEKGEFAIFINSSAQDKYYATDNAKAVGKIYHFAELHEAFETNPNARFAIVISCHESLKNFADKLDEMKVYSTILNYLDESHTLINFTEKLDYYRNDKKFSCEENKRRKVLENLLKSDYLYAFSATPDKSVTMLINGKNKKTKKDVAFEDVNYIIDVSAMELIRDGVIISPYLYSCPMNESEEGVTASVALRFMEICKEENPRIFHKILISCKDTEHLESLQKSLGESGAVVFSTCAKKGPESNYNAEDADDNGNFTGISPEKFVTDVDNYDKGDCFVLHIRQLRAGIDIRTLTDCIICNRATIPTEADKVTYVQTIGRILRPYKGERPEELKKSGKTLDDRVKNHGNVLFVIGEKMYEEIGSRIGHFAIMYYGVKNVKLFDFKSVTPNQIRGGSGDSKEPFPNMKSGNNAMSNSAYEEIEKMIAAIVDFIRNDVKRQYLLYHGTGGEFTFENSVRMLQQRFGTACGMMRPVGELIRDNDLMDIISKELLSIGISK